MKKTVTLHFDDCRKCPFYERWQDMSASGYKCIKLNRDTAKNQLRAPIPNDCPLENSIKTLINQ